jgi:hypothetical protein
VIPKGVQIALEEGVKCGACQVLLGDRPSLVTQRRLAQGIWSALAPRALGGLLAFNAALLSASVGFIDGILASQLAGASLVGTVAMLTPAMLPFVETWRFSRMSAEEIEAAVAVREPIQERLGERVKLWGEDALLDWPGAEESLIEERDEYLTRALAAAALGAVLFGSVLCFVTALEMKSASVAAERIGVQ